MHQLFTLMFLMSSAYADFTGIPKRKTETNGKESINSSLSKAESLEFGCSIIKHPSAKDLYLWKSRGNTPLVKTSSGIYDIYIAPNGAGFIKVANGKDLMTGFEYVECMSLGLSVICYHGNALK